MTDIAVASMGYMVVASCDPYNAKLHYDGQKVIKYDGNTPTEWVIADGGGDGLSMSDALNVLERIAMLIDSLSFYDDGSFKYDELPHWYKGAGYYMNGCDYYLLGDRLFNYGTMYYSIEPMS